MDLQALTDFNLVAIHGGFGRASRVAGRPKATLSRRVADLEQSLGVRLIERGARTLRLTEEGRELHLRTRGPLAEIIEAGEAMASGAPTPKGLLRVSAPVVFAHVELSRLGARFARTYPEVELEIVAEDRIVDPVEDGYDLVIRVNPAPDERLVGHRILEEHRLVVASPETERPAASSDRRDELSVRAVFTTATPSDVVWRIRSTYLGAGDLVTLRPVPAFRVSSLLMVREAVLIGSGAALLPRQLVADDLAAGRLVSWGANEAPPVSIWALYSSRRLMGAKVRAFLNMLDEMTHA